MKEFFSLLDLIYERRVSNTLMTRDRYAVRRFCLMRISGDRNSFHQQRVGKDRAPEIMEESPVAGMQIVVRMLGSFAVMQSSSSADHKKIFPIPVEMLETVSVSADPYL